MNVVCTQRVAPRSQWPCDDRIVSFDFGLHVVIDASGPTYGGHHRPVAVDVGLEAWQAAWRSQPNDPLAAMHKGIAHANAAMVDRFGDWSEWVREPIERGEGELVHGTMSATAVALSGDAWAIGHVGSNGCWLVRDGYAESMVRPHTLATRLIEEGKRAEVEPWHAQVVTRLLGFGVAVEPDVVVEPAKPGDVVVVCTNGLWPGLPEDRLEGPVRRGLRGDALVDVLLEHGDWAQDRAVLVLEV